MACLSTDASMLFWSLLRNIFEICLKLFNGVSVVVVVAFVCGIAVVVVVGTGVVVVVVAGVVVVVIVVDFGKVVSFAGGDGFGGVKFFKKFVNCDDIGKYIRLEP